MAKQEGIMIFINQIKVEVDKNNFNDASRTDTLIKKDIAKKLRLKMCIRDSS